MSYIHSIITGVPKHQYTQEQTYTEIAPDLPDHLKPRLKSILRGTKIRKRHFVTPVQQIFEFARAGKIDERFKIWEENILDFFEKQIKETLANAELNPSDIDGLCTCSSTGFIIPAIDIQLLNNLGLRRDLVRLPLFGYGCSGGVASIGKINDYLKSNPTKSFLVCVGETLSMLYKYEESISAIVSNNIFGDGFATLLMVGKEHRLAKSAPIKILDSRTYIFPDSDFATAQWITASGFETYISPKLPNILKENVKNSILKLLTANHLHVTDIEHWMLHIGGPRIVDAICQSLDLEHHKVDASYECYKNYGNQSSVSVLSAIENSLRTNKNNGYGLIMGLGPGLHMEYFLCQVNPLNYSENQ